MRSKSAGRPLRFFLLLGVGWVGLRAAMLAGPQDAGHQTVPLAVATVPDAARTPDAESERVAVSASAAPPRAEAPLISTKVRATAQRPRPTVAPGATKGRGTVAVQQFAAVSVEATLGDGRAHVPNLPQSAATYSLADNVQDVADPPVRPPVLPALEPTASSLDRWQLGAWAFWRSGSGAAPLATQGGRLGGSQVGARVDYDLIPDWGGRLAPYARITSALDRPASPEAAAGLAYQPSRLLPISLLVERRISLGKAGRNANALFVVGGFGPTLLAHGFHAEAYGQAGMVGFSQRDMVVDGKVALLRPLPRTPLSAGFSLSGGAQPGVSRLDFGPELRLRLPLPRANARLSLEWRERIAGGAAPGSGVAVTLASDF